MDKEKHIFVPGHKQWAQLYKQLPKPVYEVVDGEEVIPKSFEYEMKEIPFDPIWEQEKEVVEGEEVFLSVKQYLEKHFDNIWNK